MNLIDKIQINLVYFVRFQYIKIFLGTFQQIYIAQNIMEQT